MKDLYIQNYKIQSMIDEGSFGSVYRVKNNQKDYAAKIFKNS